MSAVTAFPSLEEQRAALAGQRLESRRRWRILHFGAHTHGSTDIVAALTRALRNLGHTVLHVDTKRTRETLALGHVDFSSGARGGYGPVFVRLAAIEPLLERFDPQIIVCDAGGLCFTPADALALRRRGILLLGVTLSDPDVFPSVAPAATTFDYHTTNAHNALAMYREAGIGNTTWLPFGIDRDYVLADVPPAPELAADVICLGHAHRPERNETMLRLAEEHDVRVYGNGWKLPGAEVVSGERQVQASRNGRIHVNFARTRAEYVNVKCGVFESVASGGVVCTSRFDEMREFFAYDEEIVAFEDPDDLSATIRGLLDDPERLEGIRRAAFARLVREHLYEHRWLALFDHIERDLADPGGTLPPERAAVLAETLAAPGDPPRRVVVSGFYGGRNVGDDLLLRSIAEGVQERSRGPMEVVVAAHNAPRVAAETEYDAFPRRDLEAGRDAVAGASAVVLGGGGLWHDHTIAKAGGLAGWFADPQVSVTGLGVLPLMAGILRRQFHVFGMGVGPLKDPGARAAVRFLAGQADSITVRDPASAALLGGLGAGGPEVRTMPDAVYGVRLGPGRVPDAVRHARAGWRIVAVNLRPWPEADAARDAVAAALARIAEAGDVAFVGVPMQAGEAVDHAALEDVLGRLGGAAPTVLLGPEPPLEEVLGVLATADAVVSMRLHACLLAHRLGRPAVGLAYDPKVRQHFKQLGLEARCLPLAGSATSLAAAVRNALALDGVLEAEATARVAELEEAAGEALERLARELDTAPGMPLP
ncbi:MAG TPA: polysaccharide pyruvyl transferase family protein, partial [Solirubrobacteraceae bacterium]